MRPQRGRRVSARRQRCQHSGCRQQGFTSAQRACLKDRPFEPGHTGSALVLVAGACRAYNHNRLS